MDIKIVIAVIVGAVLVLMKNLKSASSLPTSTSTVPTTGQNGSDEVPTNIEEIVSSETNSEVISQAASGSSETKDFTYAAPPSGEIEVGQYSGSVGSTGNPDYAAIAAKYGKTIASGNVTTDGWIINVDSWGNVTLQDTNSQQCYWNGTKYNSNEAAIAAQMAWSTSHGVRDSDGNLIDGALDGVVAAAKKQAALSSVIADTTTNSPVSSSPVAIKTATADDLAKLAAAYVSRQSGTIKVL